MSWGVYSHLHMGLHMGDTWHYRIERERMGGFKAVVLIQHFNYDHLGLKKKSSAQDAPQNKWIRISQEWWLGVFSRFSTITSEGECRERMQKERPWQIRADQEKLATQRAVGGPKMNKKRTFILLLICTVLITKQSLDLCICSLQSPWGGRLLLW